MTFNPQRLEIARKRNLLNKKELAEKIGVTPRTYARWLQHDAEPTPANIDACSRELKYPTEFFFGADIEEPATEAASFRSLSTMSAALRDGACAAGSLGKVISTWADKNFDFPKVDLPDLHLSSSPESAASTLREIWSLGQEPITNLVHLLESRGVRVFSLSENTEKVNAFAWWPMETPYVFLNTYKTAECSRFDAAHELAHLVMHQDGMVTGRSAEEEANRFASEFLMPEADVRAHIGANSIRSLDQLVRYKRRWKVSVAALNYRLHKLGIISEWKNRDFCIEIGRRFRKTEPEGIKRETSMVWSQVLKLLWSEGRTHADIASELAIPTREVFSLLFGLLDNGESPHQAAGPLSIVDKESTELRRESA